MEYRNQHLQSGCLCTVSISPVRSEHSRRTHSIINNFSLVVDARPRYKKHPCPSCCAVAQHRMDRGACVYCRLLSVLLMQIIKFGGKLVVNPRCSSIERHNFKRNKAIFCVLLLNRLHRGDTFRNRFTTLRDASQSRFHLRSRYSQSFVIRRHSRSFAVNLLSLEEFCCQTKRLVRALLCYQKISSVAAKRSNDSCFFSSVASA